jgi:hypothetical protein
VKASLEATHGTELERHEIKEQRAVSSVARLISLPRAWGAVESKMYCKLVVLPHSPGP